MGMILTVYRPPGRTDCTNGGATGVFDTICVVNVDGPFEPATEQQAFRLELGRGNNGLELIPVNRDRPGLVGPMFGGNFAGTSDCRFRNACAYFAGFDPGVVRVFDRYETAEQYAANFE